MSDVDVLVSVEAAEIKSGLVQEGATGSAQHMSIGKALGKVVKISADEIADGVVAVANSIGPTLKAKLAGLSNITVSEVSIACTLGANGSVVVAGVGAEATLTITFQVT